MSQRLQLAIDQIVAAREYTLRLLADLSPKEWIVVPPGGVTHVAWQVGHLAMAEYRLALDRLRGELPTDAALISPAFLQQFGRLSVPTADPAGYPAREELLAVLDRVHTQTLSELAAVSDDQLDLPPYKPHPLFTTRLGSLLWCARHEMLHAGQIGLLRRQLGHEPQW